MLAERAEGCDLRVPLDGGGSWDPDGDRLRHSWDFGDGSPPGRGERLVHLFAEGGRYPVTLSVDDGTGLANATDSAVSEVWIHRPPRAVAEAPSLVCAGDVVLFNGTRSWDPDDGQLLYEWDFGDGSSAPGVSPVKRYRQAGHYAVTLRVQDDSALPCDHGLDRIGVTVVDAPVAVAGNDRRVCAGQPITFDGTASRDFDDVVNGYQWDFGDQTQARGPAVAHRFTEAGRYDVVLTARDDSGTVCSEATASLQIEVKATRNAYTVDRRASRAPPLGQRLIAVVTVTGERGRAARLILDDALPAGLEIDNPTLIRAGDIGQLP